MAARRGNATDPRRSATDRLTRPPPPPRPGRTARAVAGGNWDRRRVARRARRSFRNRGTRSRAGEAGIERALSHPSSSTQTLLGQVVRELGAQLEKRLMAARRDLSPLDREPD